MKHRLSIYSWCAVAFAALLGFSIPAIPASAAPGKINVVAAENFYGNIVAQIGGEKVYVTSILSDPNVDPHEYESSVEDARALAAADLVVENSGGYDDWMDKLLSASPRSKRVLLKGFDIAPTKLPDNEHIWYNVDNVQAVAQAVTESLKKMDPADASLFDKEPPDFRSVPCPRAREDRADEWKVAWHSCRADRNDLLVPVQAPGACGPHAI